MAAGEAEPKYNLLCLGSFAGLRWKQMLQLTKIKREQEKERTDRDQEISDEPKLTDKEK